MRKWMRVAAVMLLTSSVALIVYTMVNVQVAYTHTDLTDVVKNGSAKISREDVPSKAPRPRAGPPKPAKAKQSPAVARIKVDRVQISEEFRKAIPQNSAFWNRKLHSVLRTLARGENLTRFDLLSGSKCRPETTETLVTNIPDFASYPELYQGFLRGMHCRDSDLLIDLPEKCLLEDETENVTLLFAIKSAARNFEQRQAVRETWGREGLYQGGLHVRTVFLLGRMSADEPDLGKLLSSESKIFGDLLLWNFEDSFYNLTLKEHVFYKWALMHCSKASFIFKGDDDVFVNTQATLKYVTSLHPEKASKLYTGEIISEASPLRNPEIKYYVPQTFYEGPYPPYAGGGGFLFSGPLLQSLYSISWHIPFFPIDDVYTGMCFQALGVSPEKHAGFQTFDVRVEDRENACVHRDLILVHQRNPKQTKRLWRKMNSPFLTC
ncbi:N-acetyllactosaminide beta-1,3-N-acetylglucosaminyltransferase 2 [Denticeps clupeoides]|uniref:Hexosyltransferase n=1 Tax=Denticeps clupeoides TaxID=299321 RepID=A0AAY4DC16_9TELE|nr:UDP-GlcNAc:betaGal beta-1,3-N-acetylglucosaminyltransferase 8 [Denticeps clupeoides]